MSDTDDHMLSLADAERAGWGDEDFYSTVPGHRGEGVQAPDPQGGDAGRGLVRVGPDYYDTVDVARCACGTELDPDEFLQGLCGLCFHRTRIPRYRGAELVSDRLRRRYRSGA